MTLEDPFFVVKDEVFRALNKTRGLYLRWSELYDDPNCITKEEFEWVNTELKNSLRSIEWDLEDLEDTVDIVEKNPTKFKIDNKELTIRKKFIDTTREEVKCMKDKISMIRGRDIREHAARQPLLETNEIKAPNALSTTKYSKLENDDSPQRTFSKESYDQQQYLNKQQEEHLDVITGSLGSLKNIPRHVSMDMDEHAGMLDEFGTEMEGTDSRLDFAMKRMVKVLHMNSDRRQWTAIIVLSVVLFIVIILFIRL